MADRYWVGGTASWDGTAGTKWATTSGGTGGASVPTSADDVFFTNLSTGTCTIASGNTGAKSINCTGFTGTITGSTAITVSGSITLVAGMTYTHSGVVTINGTGTLTTAGKTFSPLTINGAGITVTLGDALNMSNRNLTLTQGTFNTSASNFNVTCNLLESDNANTRSFVLNGSTVTLVSGGATLFMSNTTNLTFNAGTSTIVLVSNGTQFAPGGNLTFYNISIQLSDGTFNPGPIGGTFTCNNFTVLAPSTGRIRSVQISGTITINGTLGVTSTTANTRIIFRSNILGTTRTLTVNTLSTPDCDFRDITIAGTAAGTAPTRAGDCKGNSGIVFPAAKTVYWNLAGAQNWSANGWATTSTGTPAVDNFPLAQDTATFTNAGSVTGTITINNSWNIGTIDMSGRTSAMTLASSAGFTPVVYGNWTNGSGTTLSLTQALNFSGRVTQTITSAGKTFPVATTIDSPSGTVQLADAFVCSAAVTLTRGTLNASGYNFTALTFASNNTNIRTITMGSGLWTLTGTGTVWGTSNTTSLTFNKDTADILLSNTSTTSRTFESGGLTVNKLTIGGATGISTTSINQGGAFSELASTKTVAHTITFFTTTTIGTWSVKGTSGNVVTVNSSTAGTARTLTITNRTSGIDWLDVTDITAPLAPVTFYVGANSLLRANVRGVAAIAPTANDFIYVLTTGTSFTVPANWNNSNNEIHLFSGGGGGAGSRFTTPNGSGGAGAGGGGYTKVTNLTLTPSSSVSYAIGAGGSAGVEGSNGGSGGNTTFNAGTYTTTGGGGGQGTTTSSTGGTAGTGSTNNGGVGGQGSLSTVAGTNNGGGGGGGAGGSLGTGANGGNGFASTTRANAAGGGGGGNGGGSAGGNASSATGGTGGNNNAGAGGGTPNLLVGNGFNGGGGGGLANNNGGTTGSTGVDIANAGMGGGGGGGASLNNGTNNNGFFGGGGCGGGTVGDITRAGGAGAQGGIVIVYSAGAAPSSNSNFFLMFG